MIGRIRGVRCGGFGGLSPQTKAENTLDWLIFECFGRLVFTNQVVGCAYWRYLSNTSKPWHNGLSSFLCAVRCSAHDNLSLCRRVEGSQAAECYQCQNSRALQYHDCQLKRKD